MFGFHIVTTEEKRRLNNFKIFQEVRLNFEILKNAGPEYVKEIMRNVQLLQNDLIKKSTKTRTVEGLAYFDGASDFADKLKLELNQLLSKMIVNPNLTDPITGLKIKTGKKK